MKHKYTKKAPSPEHFAVSTTPEGLVIVQLGDSDGNQVRVGISAVQANEMAEQVHMAAIKSLTDRFIKLSN